MPHLYGDANLAPTSVWFTVCNQHSLAFITDFRKYRSKISATGPLQVPNPSLVKFSAIAASTVIVLLRCVCASEPPSLRFRGEQIGVPPLSLAESLTRGIPATDPARLRADVPQFAPVADLTPAPLALLPRALPDFRQLETARRRPSPRVSSTSSMPIVEPREDIDYKLKIVAPDRTVDFKLVIKVPATAPDGVESK